MSEKRKILMLENDERFVSKVRMGLRRKDIEVEDVKTEDDTIGLLENGDYDLLTVDFVLDSNGHDNRDNIESEKDKRKKFIKKLRQEKNILIPIIVISTHKETVQRLLDVGANSYINKGDSKIITQEIKYQIDNSIPSLIKKYRFLSDEKEDENIEVESIGKRIEILDKISIAYDQIKQSHYSYAIRYRERQQKLQFKQFLKQKLTINKIHIKNLVSFQDVHWKPQPNINILLGNNGFGKTFLSRILLALMYDGNYALQFFNIPTQVTNNLNPQKITASINIEVENGKENILIDQSKAFFNSATPKIPVLAIPDVRTFDRGRKQLPTDIQEDIVGNSAKAYIEKRPFNNTILHLLNLLCGYYREAENEQNNDKENEGKKNNEECLENEKKKNRAKFTNPIFTLMQKVFSTLTGENFIFEKVGKATEGDNNIYISASFTNGEFIKLQEASQGTLSVMVIFGLIYHYLELKNIPPTEKKPPKIQKEESEIKDASKTHGIVFIDEIDSHLHPSWQQKIVPLLREHFPDVQFFLNSHSTAVIQGTLLREVSVLHKNDHGVYLHQHKNENFIGVPTNDLLESKDLFNTKDKDSKYQEYAIRWLYEDARLLQKKYEEAADENQPKEEIERLKDDWLHMKGFEEQLQNREARLITKQLIAENRKLRTQIEQMEKITE